MLKLKAKLLFSQIAFLARRPIFCEFAPVTEATKHIKKAQQLTLTGVKYCTGSAEEMLWYNCIILPYAQADKQISRASNLRINVQILKSLNI